MAGVERIEVLREANSVIAGTDAMAGVISITSRRGRRGSPRRMISLDGGNFGTNHESVSLGGTVRRFDYFGEFSHLDTDNDLPNNEYRNKTYRRPIRRGDRPQHRRERHRPVDRQAVTNRRTASSFYGTPDDAFQTNRLYFVGSAARRRSPDRWQGSVRVGLSDQRAHFVNPTLSGQDIGGTGFGSTVTITGANGYSVHGPGCAGFWAYDSQSRSARQGIYASDDL